MTDLLIGLHVTFTVPQKDSNSITYQGKVMSRVRTPMLFRHDPTVGDAYIINAKQISATEPNRKLDVAYKLIECKPEWLNEIV